ncbi:hypothetical protein F0Q53_00735 [Anaplasma marginale]|uniref:Uncharacterized protein n=1 Tax=Anaplasma marginale TaxID=770 RepID=A0A643CN30_ANAMA|nr:hypothetical protein F0Q53_00735 [Anaplasma marginale]KAB0452888.1 hypothetical protein FY207_00735 [Anaplasma marginale]
MLATGRVVEVPLCDLVRKSAGLLHIIKVTIIKGMYGVSPLDRTFAIHETQTRPAVVGKNMTQQLPLCMGAYRTHRVADRLARATKACALDPLGCDFSVVISYILPVV